MMTGSNSLAVTRVRWATLITSLRYFLPSGALAHALSGKHPIELRNIGRHRVL